MATERQHKKGGTMQQQASSVSKITPRYNLTKDTTDAVDGRNQTKNTHERNSKLDL